jgi:hypothetical protein
MKKTIFILALVFTVLAISCEDEAETNYTEEGHYGKIVVHNEASSGKTITRIAIASTAYNSIENIYNDRVTVAPGMSCEYEIELSLGAYNLFFNGYRVTITLDDDTAKSQTISAYEDIVNNLYFDGENLVERK